MSVSSLLTTATAPPVSQSVIQAPHTNGHANDVTALKKMRNPSDLQLRLEQQLQKSRQVKASLSFNENESLRGKNNGSEEQRPFLLYDSSKEDDFEDVSLKLNGEQSDEEIVIFKQPRTIKHRYPSTDDCTEQLLKDGFRLDEQSDDEDLDLIPPRSERTTWFSCENMTSSCTIQ